MGEFAAGGSERAVGAVAMRERASGQAGEGEIWQERNAASPEATRPGATRSPAALTARLVYHSIGEAIQGPPHPGVAQTSA